MGRGSERNCERRRARSRGERTARVPRAGAGVGGRRCARGGVRAVRAVRACAFRRLLSLVVCVCVLHVGFCLMCTHALDTQTQLSITSSKISFGASGQLFSYDRAVKVPLARCRGSPSRVFRRYLHTHNAPPRAEREGFSRERDAPSGIFGDRRGSTHAWLRVCDSESARRHVGARCELLNAPHGRPHSKFNGRGF